MGFNSEAGTTNPSEVHPRIVVLFIPHLACRQPHFMHLSLYFDGPTILVLYFICIGEDQAFANVYQVTILLALMVP